MHAEQTNARKAHPWRARKGRLTLVGAAAVVGVLVAATVAVVDANGVNISVSTRKGTGDALTDYKVNGERLHYTISGDATKDLHPGASSTIDLAFHNPNTTSITVPSGAVTVTIVSPRRDCPAHANFEVVHTLTASVTIPANATRTLSELAVPTADWPVIAMKDTAFTQDACAGATFSLRYSAGNGKGTRGPQRPRRHGAAQAARGRRGSRSAAGAPRGHVHSVGGRDVAGSIVRSGPAALHVGSNGLPRGS